MKILIETPTWLGDNIMAIPTILQLSKDYDIDLLTLPNTKDIYTNFPINNIIINNTKKNFRLFNTIKLTKNLNYDIAISFRSHFYSLLITKLSAKKSFIFKNSYKFHQSIEYLNLINNSLNKNYTFIKPKLFIKPKKLKNPTIIIQTGSANNPAKRWKKEYFLEVILKLQKKFDILLIGTNYEKDINNYLTKNSNAIDLTNKTSLKELISLIGGADYLITNDSGPLHIASAFNTKTIAIFGPTDNKKTAPLTNNIFVIKENLDCMPCNKKICPLKHHNCMNLLTPDKVLNFFDKIL